MDAEEKVKFEVGDKVICLYESPLYGAICSIKNIHNNFDGTFSFDLNHPNVNWQGFSTDGFDEEDIRPLTPLEEAME